MKGQQTKQAQVVAKDEDIYVLEKPQRVQGIKALQNPTVYIASVIVAFVIYHLDRRGWFQKAWNCACQTISNCRACLNSKFELVQGHTKGTVLEGDSLYLAIGTLLIMSILIIVKKVHAKKQMEIFIEQKRLEEEEKRRLEEESEDDILELEDSGEKNSCEKINEEEYEF